MESDAFQKVVAGVIVDEQVYVFAKVVFITALLCDKDWQKVADMLQQPAQAIDLARRDLIRFGWLEQERDA